MLAAAACGAETVPPEEVAAERPNAPQTARVETVMRWVYGEETQEFRWTEMRDYANDRGTSVEAETGCRTITIGEVSYWEVARGEGLPPGKGWVRSEPTYGETIPEEREEVTTSADGTHTFIATWNTSVGVAIPEPAPHEYFDYLRRYVDHIERVGGDEVRGVRTTRYRTTLDVRRVMRAQLEEMGSTPAEIDRFVEGVDDPTEEIELWLDAEGVLRRLVTTTTSETDAGVTDRTVTTTDYVDFGVEVEVEPPPADEVIGSEEWLRLSVQRIRAKQDEWAEKPFADAFDDEASTPSPSCLD